MKQAVLSLLRHSLSYAGGLAVAHGWLSSSHAQEAAGLGVFLVGTLWGALDEYFAAKQAADKPIKFFPQ